MHTDGSKSGDGVGWVVNFHMFETFRPLPDPLSIFAAEFKVILFYLQLKAHVAAMAVYSQAPTDSIFVLPYSECGTGLLSAVKTS